MSGFKPLDSRLLRFDAEATRDRNIVHENDPRLVFSNKSGTVQTTLAPSAVEIGAVDRQGNSLQMYGIPPEEFRAALAYYNPKHPALEITYPSAEPA